MLTFFVAMRRLYDAMQVGRSGEKGVREVTGWSVVEYGGGKWRKLPRSWSKEVPGVSGYAYSQARREGPLLSTGEVPRRVGRWVGHHQRPGQVSGDLPDRNFRGDDPGNRQGIGERQEGS